MGNQFTIILGTLASKPHLFFGRKYLFLTRILTVHHCMYHPRQTRQCVHLRVKSDRQYPVTDVSGEQLMGNTQPSKINTKLFCNSAKG